MITIKANPLTEEQVQIIIQGRKDKKTAPQLHKETGASLHQIYDVYKKNGMTNKTNQIIHIDYLMNQILLSGIMGDGRIKQNGKSNCYYSECHALGEKEYCEWKMRQLGELTKNTQLYDKNKNNECCDAVEFTTKTTPSLNKYRDMKYDLISVVNELNGEGLVLYLLDDGWRHGRALNLTTNHLSSDVKEAITNRYNKVFNINSHLTGIKKKDLSFSVKDSDNIYDWIVENDFIPFDLDIMKKKFKHKLIPNYTLSMDGIGRKPKNK